MAGLKVICTGCLERTAERQSRFHLDYLAYQSGEITRDEWIARLPHVTMIGDSVCLGIHVSSPWSTFWRARTYRGRNWFLVVDPVAEIDSISKRLEKFTPLVATQYAGLGAMVDGKGERPNFLRRVLGTEHFSGQINQLLGDERFPDLILVSIGHNNADWTWWCSPDDFKRPELTLERQSERFSENFQRQIRRLIAKAQEQNHRVAIVVYGLINFESYFNAREQAENRRVSNPALYPHLETTYKYLGSFRPTYRSTLVRLARMMNERLSALIGELNREYGPNSNLWMQYSDALATADLSRVELLHPIDGWHPSAAGHNVLAEAAFNVLGPSLKFLGIC